MDGLPGAGCCHCCCSSDLRNSKNQHGKVSAQPCGDGAHTLASTKRAWRSSTKQRSARNSAHPTRH